MTVRKRPNGPGVFPLRYVGVWLQTVSTLDTLIRDWEVYGVGYSYVVFYFVVTYYTLLIKTYLHRWYAQDRVKHACGAVLYAAARSDCTILYSYCMGGIPASLWANIAYGFANVRFISDGSMDVPTSLPHCSGELSVRRPRLTVHLVRVSTKYIAVSALPFP